MTLEVEQKFAVDDLTPIRRRLEELGATWQPPVDQRDTYLAHPQRDFAQTDEALRLRHTVDELVLTYKGPRAPGALKTRREIEVHLPPIATTADHLLELLNALGFRAVADVKKRRTQSAVIHQGEAVHVALDEVERLGVFVEIELLAQESEAQAAGNKVTAMARELGLLNPQPRSYLEMLLEG